MRKVVKTALKRGLIRKELIRECAAGELCKSGRIKHTFSFSIGGGKFGNVVYCEDCTARMLDNNDTEKMFI